MKRYAPTSLFIAVISLLFLPGLSFAAVTDGIFDAGCTTPTVQGVQKCTIAWANDTGTDIGPTEIAIPSGWILRVETVPHGTNAPTALYDIDLFLSATAATALDLCGAQLDNRSATVTEGAVCLMGGAYIEVWQAGRIYPYISGLTDANDDEGTIILWIATR